MDETLGNRFRIYLKKKKTSVTAKQIKTIRLLKQKLNSGPGEERRNIDGNRYHG